MIASPPAPNLLPPSCSLTELPPSALPLLLLLLLLSPSLSAPVFILYFKGPKTEKGKNQQRQSSNSTYKHAGITMGWLLRCHDNTQGSEEGGIRRPQGRDGRKEEVEQVAIKKERRRDGGCYLGCIYLQPLWLFGRNVFSSRDLPCQSVSQCVYHAAFHHTGKTVDSVQTPCFVRRLTSAFRGYKHYLVFGVALCVLIFLVLIKQLCMHATVSWLLVGVQECFPASMLMWREY